MGKCLLRIKKQCINTSAATTCHHRKSLLSEFWRCTSETSKWGQACYCHSRKENEVKLIKIETQENVILPTAAYIRCDVISLL